MSEAGVFGTVEHQIRDAILADVAESLEGGSIDEAADEDAEVVLGPLDVAMDGISKDPRATPEGRREASRGQRGDSWIYGSSEISSRGDPSQIREI
jgi:hypothetical protein